MFKLLNLSFLNSLKLYRQIIVYHTIKARGYWFKFCLHFTSHLNSKKFYVSGPHVTMSFKVMFE